MKQNRGDLGMTMTGHDEHQTNVVLLASPHTQGIPLLLQYHTQAYT
jgi:hypothetical protein